MASEWCARPRHKKGLGLNAMNFDILLFASEENKMFVDFALMFYNGKNNTKTIRQPAFDGTKKHLPGKTTFHIFFKMLYNKAQLKLNQAHIHTSHNKSGPLNTIRHVMFCIVFS